MFKPVLIVCRENFLYGAYTDALSDMENYVEATITEPYSDERLEDIVNLLRTRGISTILTRGIWYNRLLSCKYIQEHPSILVKQIPIDTRSQLREIDEIRFHNYKNIGLIVVNAPLTENSSGGNRYSFTTFERLNLYLLSINDLDSAETTIQNFLASYQFDAFWGDAAEFEEYLQDYPIIDFSIHGLSLRAMIHDAVRYARSLREQDTRDFDHLFDTMLRHVSEGIFVFDPEGRILANNGNYIVNRVAPTLSRNDTITDITGMSVEQLLELPSNSVVVLQGRHYLANVFSSPTATSERYLLLLNSRSRIASQDLTARTQMASSKFTAKYTFNDIIYVDEKTKHVLETAKTYALFDETVLITGETGTGKELFASAIHHASQRRPFPFVVINCATFSESLIDSELFGYEKGSFTGALSTGKRGLFEIAHQGTLFLDEVSEIPLPLQSRLLRVLQERTIRRIGGKEEIPVDVRIVAASNKNLLQQCQNGLFRYDLYYRLSVLELDLPPLRERPSDIIPLFQFFLKKSAQAITKKITWNDPDIFNILLHCDWHGNIRALESTALRTVILARRHVLERDDIVRALSHSQIVNQTPLNPTSGHTFSTRITDSLDELEHRYVSWLMSVMGNNKEEVSRYLNISKPTLWRKLNFKREHDEP